VGEIKENETRAQSVDSPTIASQEGYMSILSQPLIWTPERSVNIKLTDFGVGMFLGRIFLNGSQLDRPTLASNSSTGRISCARGHFGSWLVDTGGYLEFWMYRKEPRRTKV